MIAKCFFQKLKPRQDCEGILSPYTGQNHEALKFPIQVREPEDGTDDIVIPSLIPASSTQINQPDRRARRQLFPRIPEDRDEREYYVCYAPVCGS